jgi:thiamine biosynthesis lipoprotein
MIRCKPLLGTYVEISTKDEEQSLNAIENAFVAIKTVQDLMSFHQPESDLSQINANCHLEAVRIHPWTAQTLMIAQEIHHHSGGLFNCGIGHYLVANGLLPRHLDIKSIVGTEPFGDIADLQFVEPTLVRSDKPLCLDLGGIAKGFAVDLAVNVLQHAGISSGLVNAGGDMRAFGDQAQAIQIRNPSNPHELIKIGSMTTAAIATTSLCFAKRDTPQTSYIVNPFNQESIQFSASYSVIADQCVYADALTKVVSISGNINHPCLGQFSAQAIKIPGILRP